MTQPKIKSATSVRELLQCHSANQFYYFVARTASNILMTCHRNRLKNNATCRWIFSWSYSSVFDFSSSFNLSLSFFTSSSFKSKKEQDVFLKHHIPSRVIWGHRVKIEVRRWSRWISSGNAWEEEYDLNTALHKWNVRHKFADRCSERKMALILYAPSHLLQGHYMLL